MSETPDGLNEVLFQTLQQQKLVLLATIDAETGAPVQTAISWVLAVEPGMVRFAVDSRSRINANLRKHPAAAVSLFADESIYAIHGEAVVHEELLADVPLKLSCIDLRVTAVRNIMYYGSKIAAEPICEKTYDPRAAEKLDMQVFAAMKKA